MMKMSHALTIAIATITAPVASAATYTEDFSTGITGSAAFGTSDPRSPSEVGWTAITDNSFAEALGDANGTHGAGNLVSIANRKPTVGGTFDFGSRFAFVEGDNDNATASNVLYMDNLWSTSEPLGSEGEAIDIAGATVSFDFEGSNADGGPQVNDEEFRFAIQLSGGQWYVSDFAALTQGLDGIKTFTLTVSENTVWDSLTVDASAAAGSRLGFNDSNVTLSSSLDQVVKVGWYYRPNTESPSGVDDFEISNFEVVPEPSALTLLGLAALPMLRRRRPA